MRPKQWKTELSVTFHNDSQFQQKLYFWNLLENYFSVTFVTNFDDVIMTSQQQDGFNYDYPLTS